MSEEQPFQYTLRTLFIIMTVSAVLLGIFAPWLRRLSPMHLVALAVWLALYVGCVLFVVLIVSFLGRLKRSDPLSPQRIAAFRNEFQAEALVEALAGENIRAVAVGSFTSGFRAEAPGWVDVLVAAQDLPRARETLEKLAVEAENVAEFEQEEEEDAE